jgi:riboflavin-specific deaminase-like protein
VELELLHPERRPVSVAEQLSDLRLSERATDERPYMVLNMVASVDGRTTLGGHVGALTGPVDQQLLYALRTQADALMVGAGTVRNERYGSLIPDGMGPSPLVVIVSGKVDLPRDLPLLQEPDTRILIATTTDQELGFDHLAQVEYLQIPGEGGRVPCGDLCRALRTDYGVRSVVCEGGPSLNEALLADVVVDELFLSVAPMLVGGGERTLADAAPSHGAQPARLVSVATADDYLFLRYAL